MPASKDPAVTAVCTQAKQLATIEMMVMRIALHGFVVHDVGRLLLQLGQPDAAVALSASLDSLVAVTLQGAALVEETNGGAS